MSVILWKIIIVSIFLAETVIGAFLGWRVLKLMERVRLIQIDRNEMDEERRKLSNKLRLKGIEIDNLNKKVPVLSDLEKKMILASLNMPQYKNTMEDPKTKYEVRKVYRELKERLKESIVD